MASSQVDATSHGSGYDKLTAWSLGNRNMKLNFNGPRVVCGPVKCSSLLVVIRAAQRHCRRADFHIWVVRGRQDRTWGGARVVDQLGARAEVFKNLGLMVVVRVDRAVKGRDIVYGSSGEARG